jgi:hypothetical protein
MRIWKLAPETRRACHDAPRPCPSKLGASPSDGYGVCSNDSGQDASAQYAGRLAPRPKRLRIMRQRRFAHVRNSVGVARLLTMAFLEKPLYELPSGVEQHFASEHGLVTVRSFLARTWPSPEPPLPPRQHATRRPVAVSSRFPAGRHTPARQPTCSPV